MKQYKPATKNTNKDCNSSASAATTPKSSTSRTVRGRAAKSKENHSSPVVPDTDSLSANSFELITDCLNRLNSQNQKLLNRVTELDAVVIEQNKNIEILKTKIDSHVKKDHSPELLHPRFLILR